jgi:hypothetical protein
LLLGLMPALAQGAVAVQDASNGSAGSTGVNLGSPYHAQPFKAIHTGTVSSVELYLSCAGNSHVVVTVERTSGSPAAPDGYDPLASSGSAWVDGAANWFSFSMPYGDGQALGGFGSSWAALTPDSDFAFTVFVIPASDPGTPTATPTALPTRGPTAPPTSTRSGSSSNDTGAMLWFLPIGLVASLGGMLALGYRSKRRIA